MRTDSTIDPSLPAPHRPDASGHPDACRDLEDLADLVTIANLDVLAAARAELKEALERTRDGAAAAVPHAAGRIVRLPSGGAITVAVRTFRVSCGTVGVHLLALAVAGGIRAPRSEWLAWERALLGPDWFYGGYLVSGGSGGAAAMAVYLNSVGWPVAAPGGRREGLESVAHHLHAGGVELVAS